MGGRQVREQSKVLWQVGKVALLRGTIDGQVAVEEDIVPERDATAVQLQQPQDGLQQAALARSIRPHQG